MTFPDKVYQATLSIPKGRVATYAQIARIAGRPRAFRAVGNVLHNNPRPNYYPCHRVVNFKGELANKFAFGGLSGQKKRLEKEGIRVKRGRVDLERYQMDNGR